MRQNIFLRKLSSAIYKYRKSKIRYKVEDVLNREPNRVSKIKPVFLLGTQGGGLTLTARMLWRHKNSVSIIGNHKWWNGSPELHNDLSFMLPESLRLRNSKGMEKINKDGKRESWFYATNKYLNFFRKTPNNEIREEGRKFINCIKKIKYLNASCPNKKQFVDKSQSFTLKINFIEELLGDENPFFILISRNPYALCYRAAVNVYDYVDKTIDEKIKIACQHWANSMECALEDSSKVDNFCTLKFENVIRHPTKKISNICSFLGWKFDKKMIPQKGQKWPIGGSVFEKWYPLRESVNEKYFEEMQDRHKNIVKSECGDIAQKLGYKRP